LKASVGRPSRYGIGWPRKFDLYVRKQPERPGSLAAAAWARSAWHGPDGCRAAIKVLTTKEGKEMDKHFEMTARLAITTRVVAAYVSHNSIGVSGLPGIIRGVGDCFAALSAEAEGTSTARPEPVVPVRGSVSMNHVTCLACGKKQKMLRRHLATAHELTPSAYREMFRLEAHYPMTAPNYARVRSEIAKRIGLGRRERPTSRQKNATPRKDAA
jgi:predicted transcriptional regulator